MRRGYRRDGQLNEALSPTPAVGGASVSKMTGSVDFPISFDGPDEDGWIVARVPEVAGTVSQGRT